MATLDEVVNVGRSNIVPGYVLSRPRLEEINLAEQWILDNYKRVAYAQIGSLPSTLASELIRDVNFDVKSASYTLGMPLYGVWVRTRAMLPFLTYLSARVKHPQVKIEDIHQAYIAGDAELIARVTHELWDCGDVKKRRWKGAAAKPIDWSIPFKRFTEDMKRDPADFALLTKDQLIAILSGTEMNEDEQRRNGAFDKFEAICDNRKLEPSELAAQTDAVLVEWVRAETDESVRHYPIDAKKMQELLREYIAACA